mmetsp:Transcript_33284/g.53660  ORF Transcript_33284/g.53660 Transcript_33284/m.53660 type:complete len:636 (-) Transcript_33284:1147-3054(-)
MPSTLEKGNVNQQDRGVVDLARGGIDDMLKMDFEAFIDCCLVEPELGKFLDSYLACCSRPWEGNEENHERDTLSHDAHMDLRRKVFSLYHRLVLDKSGWESLKDTNPERFSRRGALVRESKIIDATKILDICALFGTQYPTQTNAWLSELFQMEPLFIDDLVKAFELMEELVWSRILAGNDRTMNESKVLDLRDVCSTVYAFYSCVPVSTAASIVAKVYPLPNDGVLESLFSLYDGLVIPMMDWVEKQKGAQWHRVSKQIRQGMLCLIHLSLFHYYWQPLEMFLGPDENTHDGDAAAVSKSALIENLLESFETVIQEGEGLGLGDYQHVHRLGDRLELCFNIPEAMEHADRIQYLIDVSQTLPKTSWETSRPLIESIKLKNPKAAPKKSTNRLRPLVANVKEVLPDLGTFYIEQLLGAVGNSPESAIQRYLEGDVPVSVRHLDPKQEKPKLVVVDRGPKSAAELLDELVVPNNRFGDSTDDDLVDEELKALREKIKRAAAVYDEFEDEYDDAYDDIGFKIRDNGGLSSASENEEEEVTSEPISSTGSKWKVGMVDVDGVKRDEHGKIIVEDEDDLLKPNINHQPPPKAPEPKKQQQNESSTPSRGRRRYKQANKSRIGNHSRKSGAAKKQARGMF